MTAAGKVFVQWKGTDVCLDWSCPCGARHHVDAYFAYALRCPKCKQVWVLPDHLALVRAEADYKGIVLYQPDPERELTWVPEQ